MANLPQRHTIRWRGYDYANVGAYYLTICTQDRLHLFGRIVDGVMHPSPIGEWAQRCWNVIPDHMSHVDVGEFVVMPNHVHGIVVIRERLVVPVGGDHDRPQRPPAPPTPPTNSTGRTMPVVPVGSLGRIVRAYKSAVTRMAYRDGLLPQGTPVWQRNYWDRVIRDDGEHERIAKYIRDNPMKWERDRFRATHR
jgi:putative transposase